MSRKADAAAAALDASMVKLAAAQERRSAHGVAGEATPILSASETARGKGVVRTSTDGRTTVAKQLRFSAEVVERYERAHAEGRVPVLSRLVERLLREHLDGLA
jgi:hypothetical protein